MASEHKKKRILIIEDDADAGRMYQVLLRRWGYEAYWAKDGEEGITRAREILPDLILMDVMLPKMTGYTAAQQLHKDARFATIPIIFLTVLDGFDARSKAFNSGADDFINKVKISHEELKVRIQAALQRIERIRRAQESNEEGIAVGVLSFAGGTGVSTIALNLAAYAAQYSDRPVQFLDLSYPVSYFSVHSHTNSNYHLLSLLAHPPEEINLVTIGRYTMQHPLNFSFIPSPASPVPLDKVDPLSFVRLLQTLKADNYFVIVDLDKGALPLEWKAFPHFDWICLVATSRLESRVLTTMAFETLPSLGVNPSRIRIVFNDITGMAGENDMTALPRQPDVVIPRLPGERETKLYQEFELLWRLVNYPAG